ncbi:hypothetical protein F4556_000466 [Kitasatospora gansuensis]|uniref:Uncharacterized protein n=1 Tax=Kitasatospora gansuensis TaxID=258050 RepID=A0A7W7S6R4_9ACTN|nr:hypothetical protein [Kitasatospora gansuensis]MBB4944931.1 hypothetical protein [Kitasatospora gansuensis]
MEIEVARPLLALDGSNLDGDTEVLLMPGLLKLVSDLRSLEQGDQEVDYSNAEFVTVHFDQHAGTLQEAEAQLDQRLHAVALLMDDLYQDEANRALSAAVRQATATAYETFATARFDPAVLRAIGGVQLPQDALVAPRTYQVPNNELRMLIHYTVGIAPEKLGPALTALGDAARDKSNVGNSAKQHAQRAHAVAQECFGLVTPGAVHPDHVAEFEGFLALVFVQVAGFADIVADSEPESSDSEQLEAAAQPKNYLVVLSRVPLRTVYDALHADVRAALHTHADAIEQRIGDRIIPGFSDGDSRYLEGLAEVTIKEYLRSALGHFAAVDQERVFGGMNETGLDPTVHGEHDPDPAVGRGIPVELRLHGTQRPSWDVFAREAKALLGWSRQHAGLSDRPMELTADHWLASVNHLLDAYEHSVGKVTGHLALTAQESVLGFNWQVTTLNSQIATLLRAYPGFPTRERGTGWQPTALADFGCVTRFVGLTELVRNRIEGFTPDPFPLPVQPFAF